MPEPDQGLRPTFSQALAFWFRLGWISFGGPAGQIALMHEEVVRRRGWIDEARFTHALNFCMLLPGPEAQQLATYIGWILHRTRGAVAAGVLFVLPSLLILVGLSWLYAAHGQQPQVAAVLWGLKPAVVAVVAVAAHRIGSRVLRHRLLWGVAVWGFVGLAVLSLPFVVVLAVAAAVGWWARDRLAPEEVLSVVGSSSASASASASARRAVLVCLSLWALLLGGLWLAFGSDGLPVQMGWFFTQAALLTFGGAYAVLPFVMEGAVDTHGWLSAAQMIDGLALGETTPGPLIMVVAFVGFMGGWSQPLFGPGAELASGVLGAVVATVFTFLPSFLFILGGAPLLERTRRLPAWQGPLKAITAAVVGVVLNLAVVFAVPVFWPGGLGGLGGPGDGAASTPVTLWANLDGPAVALTAVCAAALLSGRLGVVPVILGAAACGWGLSLL